MLFRTPTRAALARLCWAWLASAAAAVPPAAQDTVIPQTALSLCSTLTAVSRETVAAGTGLAVSADGRRLLEYLHTPGGAELKLRDLDARAERRVYLAQPALPPGILWRIREAVFSPAGDLLVVSSTGAIWVLAAETGQVLHLIGFEPEKQVYPGDFSLSGGELAVVFWPPESYLADAVVKKPIEVRFYDARTGSPRRSLALTLDSTDQWSKIELAPDGTRLAVLRRAMRWPGKARLLLFAADAGKLLWEKKVGAEDFAWSADGRSLAALGSELVWLNATTGKQARKAERKVRSSEFHKLRIAESLQLAVGHFSRYNPFKRLLDRREQRNARLMFWRLDTAKTVCEIELGATTSADAWLTARGEVVALEETYQVRSPLRLLQSARIVTYRLRLP